MAGDFTTATEPRRGRELGYVSNRWYEPRACDKCAAVRWVRCDSPARLCQACAAAQARTQRTQHAARIPDLLRDFTAIYGFGPTTSEVAERLAVTADTARNALHQSGARYTAEGWTL